MASDFWGPPRQRIPRRVVVVAYGSAGRIWLLSLAGRLRRFELLDRLIGNGMLQLWCVAADDFGDRDRDVRSIAADSTPHALRELLEFGARAENRVGFRNVDMQSVLVLERWSLFDGDSLLRAPLARGLKLASHAGCDAYAAPEFDYEWLSLLDSVRAAATISQEERNRVLALMAVDDVAMHTLLIDRVDAGNGVISKALADECYSSIAIAILTSDEAFSPADGSGSKLFVNDPSPKSVTPFAVVNLHHSADRIRSALSEHIRLQLTEASLDSSFSRWSPEIPAFDALADLEVRELFSGTFSARAARERRDRSVGELLRVILATRGRDRTARDQLDRALARMRQVTGTTADTVQGTMAVGLAAASPTTSVGIAAVLVAALGLAAWWWRGRRGASSEAKVDMASASDRRGAEEAQRQWHELGDRLGGLIGKLTQEVRLPESAAPNDVLTTWQRNSANPFDWNLVRNPLPRAGIAPLTEREYAQLAERCLQLLDDGRPAEEVLGAAIDQMAAEQMGQSTDLAAVVVRTALTKEHARSITESLEPQSTPLLASTPTNAVATVHWIADERAIRCGDLTALEPVTTRDLVRCASHDDPQRTTRLAVGKPVAWTSVISLSSIAP